MMVTGRPLAARTRPLLLTAMGLGVACVIASPYFAMLMTAVKPDREVGSIPPVLLPETWALANFINVFDAVPLAQWLWSTFIVAIGTTVLVMIVAIPAGYYTARVAFRGRRLYLYAILMTQLFSPAVLVIGLYRQFLELGLIDNLLAVILADAAFTMAFAIWILRGFFSTIPREIEEAAWMDGCSRFQSLTKIVLPLSRPALATAAIFTFIAAWNEFVVALTIISSRDKTLLTVGLQAFIGRYAIDWQWLFASAMIAIVPVLILFLLIQRHLVSGLTAGAAK